MGGRTGGREGDPADPLDPLGGKEGRRENEGGRKTGVSESISFTTNISVFTVYVV
jgi:hypothetical protein